MHLCVECEEAITNPVCPECLAEGIAAWAGEHAGPAVATAVFNVTESLAYRMGSTNCIKCRTPMGLCTYCYTNALIDVLKSHPVLLAQFLYFFSFDLEKQGYERDLQKQFGIVV